MCKFRCRTSKVFIPLINLLKFDNFTVCFRLFSEFLNHSCVAVEPAHIWHLLLRLSECFPRCSCSRQGLWGWGCCCWGLSLFLLAPPFCSSLFLPFFPPSRCFFHMSFVRGLLEGSIFWESFLLPTCGA